MRKSKLGEYKLDYLYREKKTSPRLVKQALQRPQERNKGHLKLRGRRRGKGRGRGSPRLKNKPIVVCEIVGMFSMLV
jgi:hypothetical protein